jgi:hypothetical protein
VLTCIHVREDTFIYSLFQATQVRVRTLLNLGTQNDEIRQVLVESDRGTMLGFIDLSVLSGTTTQG